MSQRMIPLHIADQAVAAVEDELAKVKAERDQLKADLEKSDGVVWTLSVENARLKAEVERLTKMCQATSPDGFIHIRDIKHLNAAKGVQS